MQKESKLILAGSILTMLFLCTACSGTNFAKNGYSLPPELSAEEQEDLRLKKENASFKEPEVTDFEPEKNASYYIDRFSPFQLKIDIYDIDPCEMSNLDYVPALFVKIPENSEKEETLNRLLLESYISRLPADQQWMNQVEINILYRSEKYLCFEYISHAALPDNYDRTQLIFTLNLEEERLIDYPEIETEWNRYDKFQAGSLYKEMEQWLEKPVEEQNLLRGECDYEVYGKYGECDGITFPCAQVKKLENKERQEQINQLLQAPLVDLILDDRWDESDRELKEWRFGSVKTYIACKTDKWLSVVYSVQIENASQNFGDGIADIGITINMETGERFMLDDLFEIEGLSNWICANIFGNEELVINSLRGCVWTEREMAEYFSDDIIGPELYRYKSDWCSFYLYQGKIVILGSWSSFDMEIPLPEVYEYLKTDPWYD